MPVPKPPTPALPALPGPLVELLPALSPGVPTPQPHSRRSPAEVYLTSLSPSSRPAQRSALDAIARVVSQGGIASALAFPWELLRYEHTSGIRALLAAQYAPATANRMIAALRGVLKDGWRLGLIPHEAYLKAADIATVRGKSAPKGRALTEPEVARLFGACTNGTRRGRRDAALLILLYGCGLRRAEAVALDLADYHGERADLRVLGKGAKEVLAPVPPEGGRWLDAWCQARGDAEGPLLCRFSRADHPRAGVRLSPAGIVDILNDMAVRAGVEEFRPHDLRRTFVSTFLAKGVDMNTARALARHEDIKTTQRYDRREETRIREVAGTIPIPKMGEVTPPSVTEPDAPA